MDTSQRKFNDNLEYQSLISHLCPTEINENSRYFEGKKRLLPAMLGRSRYPIN